MHTIDIPEKNVHVEIPSSIDEMTSEQFGYFIRLILEFSSGTIDLQNFKLKLVKMLLNVRPDARYYFLSEEEKDEIISNLIVLSALMTSFFSVEIKDERPVSVLNLKTVHNFFPVIAKKYYGPKDALQDVTFGEYRIAHGYFKSYSEKQDEQDLNHLIAVLYRPRKKFIFFRRLLPWFDGYHRIMFTAKSNPEFLQRRARRISKLPMHIRYGIYIFFSGCEGFLSSGRPVIEGNEIDMSILYQGTGESSSDPGIGLIGLLFSLAETKVFGSIDETDNQNLWDIMIRLYQVMKQTKDLESKYGKGKSI